MTKKPLHILVNLLVGGGKDSVKSGLKTYTWICKNCAMVACRRDNLVAKVPGPEPADCATNVYSLNRRAVMVNENITCTLDSLKTLTITKKA